MLANFNAPLVTLDGSPVTESGKPVTYAALITNALLLNESNLTGEEKLRRFELARKIHGATAETDMTVEEAALVKKAVGKSYGPLVVGRIFELIEA